MEKRLQALHPGPAQGGGDGPSSAGYQSGLPGGSCSPVLSPKDGGLGVLQPLQRLVSHQQAGADELVGHGSSPLFIQAVAVYGIGGF